MDRGEDSGGEHGRRTRRVAGVHRAACREAASRRRARWWVPRSGARAGGCRAAARVLGAAQRRARWVPRSGAGRRPPRALHDRVFLMCDWIFYC